ncbi:MAG: ribonuclease HI [Burkholderiaceae bacterium]|nr:ribonuclease HI [Microbacteriaceae bacterium]
MITAAADGSALGNPGPAGWAWYVDDDNWDAGGWKHATNNQGELKAVLELFRATAHIDDDLLVLCDSQYVINCVTKWMRGWKAKGWRKADGKAVMNVDLLTEIDAAILGRRYRFEWVKGHANHPLNEAADVRARAVSEAFQRGGSIPIGPGYVRGGAAAAERATPVVAPPRVSGVREPAPTPAAPVRPAHPELFSFDDDEDDNNNDNNNAAKVRMVLELSPAEHARLLARAGSAGLGAEALLRSLI